RGGSRALRMRSTRASPPASSGLSPQTTNYSSNVSLRSTDLQTISEKPSRCDSHWVRAGSAGSGESFPPDLWLSAWRGSSARRRGGRATQGLGGLRVQFCGGKGAVGGDVGEPDASPES